MKKISFLLIPVGLLLGGCCNEDFINPDYDFIEFAVDLTARIDNGCSDPEFSTEGATADGNSSTCRDNPLHNRWFKFQAPNSYIYIDLRVGGSEGTQLNSYVTLWDTDGETQLECNSYLNPDDDIFMYYGDDLNQGEWYYISVDVEDSESIGTFAICIFTD